VAINCYYTNCLSLRNKLLEIKQLVIDKSPHIILLTETWLEEETDGEVSIEDYYVYRVDSARGRAGGVAMYLSNLLPSSLVTTLDPPKKIDTLWVSLALRDGDKLLIGLVYRPPSSTQTDDQELLENIKLTVSTNRHSHLLLVGDFNAPKVAWDHTLATDNGFSVGLTGLVHERNWTQHVQSPTRIRLGQNPSLLDLVITNETHFVDKINHLPPLGLSDHLLIQFDYLCYWACAGAVAQKLRGFQKRIFQSCALICKHR
jgi:exonuclease III